MIKIHVSTYTYDNNSNVLTYDMIKDEQTENSITYEYNGLNRLTKLTNGDNIFSYTYDDNGNLRYVMNNAQANIDIRISYNAANLPVTQVNRYGGKNYSYSMSYYVNGQKYKENDTNNNISKTYSYNSLGRLKNESETVSNKTVSNIGYSYDAGGNRIQMSKYNNTAGTTDITDYTYDANNRLTSMTDTVSGELTGMTQYYYDDNGNTIAEQQKTYTAGNENSTMAVSGHSGGSTMKLYQYDDFNRLVQYNDGGTEATYKYNTSNLRTSKTVNGSKTNFVWNEQNVAGETKNGTTTSYTYDPTGVIISSNGTDTTRFIKDPHGNVVATSKNDSIIGTYDYTAFGNQLENTDSSNPFRYCGEYYDNESGLVYLRNRYYDSATGRFITEDPIKDGLNWYVYCGGEPVMGIDPSGEIYIVDDLARETWRHGAEHYLRNKKGWYLTATLLELSTEGEGQHFNAGNGDYASNLIKNDSGFRKTVNNLLWENGTKHEWANTFFTFDYAFDVSGGDLGAALHNVRVSVDAYRDTDATWITYIDVYDTFDFTEFKNPLLFDDLKSVFLWTMNDLAFLDQTMGVIDPVSVHISYIDQY